jgi:hypothetical protein
MQDVFQLLRDQLTQSRETHPALQIGATQ